MGKDDDDIDVSEIDTPTHQFSLPVIVQTTLLPSTSQLIESEGQPSHYIVGIATYSYIDVQRKEKMYVVFRSKGTFTLPTSCVRPIPRSQSSRQYNDTLDNNGNSNNYHTYFVGSDASDDEEHNYEQMSGANLTYAHKMNEHDDNDDTGSSDDFFVRKREGKRQKQILPPHPLRSSKLASSHCKILSGDGLDLPQRPRTHAMHRPNEKQQLRDQLQGRVQTSACGTEANALNWSPSARKGCPRQSAPRVACAGDRRARIAPVEIRPPLVPASTAASNA